MIQLKKRPVTLLEVLIAFTLVIFCLMPLLYPHVAIVKSQREFVRKIQLDHSINLLTGLIMEKLHKNDIPWGSIEDGRMIPIDDDLWNQINQGKYLHYKGVYQFKVIIKKPKDAETAAQSAYLVNLRMMFLPKIKGESVSDFADAKNPLIYEVKLFIKRDSQSAVPEAKTEENPSDNKDSKKDENPKDNKRPKDAPKKDKK